MMRSMTGYGKGVCELGDKVVTIAGIHGIVNKVNDDSTIQIEVSPGSFMKIEKSAISLEWSEQLNKTATK